MASIICGNCGATHRSVEGVKRCHAGEAAICGDHYNAGYNTDGEVVIGECAALRWDDERGSRCEAGHTYVFAEVRHREGWEYAEDAGEARLLARAGVIPVGMDGCAPPID